MEGVVVFFIILVVVLVAIVLFVGLSYLQTKKQNSPVVTGGGIPKIAGNESLQNEIYLEMLPYIKECGTTHVEEYLITNMSLNTKDLRVAKNIKHSRLLSIIEDIVFYGGVKSLADFMQLTGLRYIHFLPKKRRCLFVNNYEIKLDDIIEKHLRKELPNHVPDSYIKYLIPGNRYYRFAVGYIKKNDTAIKKAGDRAYTIDTLAYIALIDIVKKIYSINTERDELMRIVKNMDLSRLREYDINLLRKVLDRPELLLSDLKWERKQLERQRIANEIRSIEQQKQANLLEEKRIAELEQLLKKKKEGMEKQEKMEKRDRREKTEESVVLDEPVVIKPEPLLDIKSAVDELPEILEPEKSTEKSTEKSKESKKEKPEKSEKPTEEVVDFIPAEITEENMVKSEPLIDIKAAVDESAPKPDEKTEYADPAVPV